MTEKGNPSYYGQLREFCAQTSDWMIYKRRMDNYFAVNSITESTKKKALLLNALDEEAYKLINSLSLPKAPEDKTYEELTTLFNTHFRVAESVFVARSKFFACFKDAHESATEWAARVRSLAINCRFEEAVFDMMLRDRFIIGFDKGSVQSKLFKQDLTSKFADVIQEAATELAAEEVSSSMDQVFIKKEPSVQHINSGRIVGSPGGSKDTDKCECCGRKNHVMQECRFRNYVCHSCKVKGHLAPMCPKKNDNSDRNKRFNRKNQVQNFIETEDLFSIEQNQIVKNPFIVHIFINKISYSFQLDTGASISAMSEKFWEKNFSEYKLFPPNKNLNVYTGEKMLALGFCKFKVSYNDITKFLDVYVIKNGGPPILGRDFMSIYDLNVSQINFFDESVSVDNLVKKYHTLFSPGIGTFNKGTISLKLRDDLVAPKFVRARPLPYGIREKVERELSNLENSGIIKSVDFAHWATPIVPVLKKSGAVRICGDFKVTVNPVLEIDQFPLPRIEDLFSKLEGGIVFSKIDLSQAYAQICLDEKSKELVTISTHKGLFQYQRLPYGIACAPSKFQKIMESLTQDMDGCVCFLDDILVCGRNISEHLSRLNKLLSRLQSVGLKIEPQKCAFFQEKVCYLGYIIDKDGLHTTPEKISAINNAPKPQNIKELQSVLGMINYYGKFVPNLATLLNPLYNLLQKNSEWVWSKDCDRAFGDVKKILTSADVLVHYNPNFELKLITDASPCGVGCVLAHVLPDGRERPIAYASRTLSSAERNYPQIEREGLAIIFGLCKFNQYLYGREFILVSDNKPLIAIFSPKKGIPQYSANRLRRWAVILSNYNYKPQYIKSKNNLADCLSRLPVKNNNNEIWECVDPDYINYFAENSLISTNFDLIKEYSKQDNVLQSIIKFVKTSWPKYTKNDFKFKAFYVIRNQLTIEHEVLLWNNRIVIPEKLHNRMLEQLHLSHLGVVKMKNIARSYFFWPGINKSIEDFALKCETCAVHKISAPKTTLNPWEWPTEVFSRIHIDYMGPFLKKYFLIILDAHSKWVEVFITNDITSRFTISALHSTFARFGLPKSIVSDNGSNITSYEFKSFLDKYNIKHTTIAPYVAQSNGAAENAVKNVKNSIKNCLGRNKTLDIQVALHNFLFDYRNAPHSTTGVSPAMLMFGRDLRTRFSVLKPDFKKIQERVNKKQQTQIKNFGGKVSSKFKIGDKVLVKDYREINKFSWIPGIIVKVIGNCTYIVKIPQINKIWKRHFNQIRKTNIQSGLLLDSESSANEGKNESKEIIEIEGGAEGQNDGNPSSGPLDTPSTSYVQRPRRTIKPPERLTY